jgi:hypothetical protein
LAAKILRESSTEAQRNGFQSGRIQPVDRAIREWRGKSVSSPKNPKMVGEKKKSALILAFSPRRRNYCSRVWSI